MLILSDDEVEPLLDLAELRSAMESALIDLSAGRVIQPLRSVVRIPEHDGWFGLMPAVYEDMFGAKLVTVFPRNAALGLPTHNAVIHLFRADTGEPLAALGGRAITARRTAAVSAIATQLLADPHARILAILGSGVQAQAHYEALKLVRTFAEVRVWSRTPQHAVRFARQIGACAMSAEAAVTGADIVVVATHSSEPILKGAWLKQGAHINAVGAVGTQAREIDDAAMTSAVVVVESREAALSEAADIIQSGAPIYAELGELLSGAKSKLVNRLTIYKSVGVAVEDIAAAKLIYQKALAAKRVI